MVARGHNYGLCHKCGKTHIHPMKGRKHSKKTREEISKRNEEYWKTHDQWNKGLTKETDSRVAFNAERCGKPKTFSKKTYKKLSEIRSIIMIERWKDPKYRKEQIERQSGPNHWQWKGGEGSRGYTSDFTRPLRRRIRERDLRTCQLCGVKESQLEGYLKHFDVHHIDYDRKNCDERNLITLCRKCNIRVNNHKECWSLYFNYRMEMKH